VKDSIASSCGVSINGSEEAKRDGGEKMKITEQRWMRLAVGAVGLIVVALLWSGHGSARARQGTMSATEGEEQPFVVEYYYKTKWGHAEEFLTLFKKNHYPLLKKEMELGRILKVSMVSPRYHTTEDGRWDYRVTIVFKSAAIESDNFDSAALAKQLYPDQETYKKEEQRRFEILDAHWDSPIKDVAPDAK
jgi:hypothetical protein